MSVFQTRIKEILASADSFSIYALCTQYLPHDLYTISTKYLQIISTYLLTVCSGEASAPVHEAGSEPGAERENVAGVAHPGVTRQLHHRQHTVPVHCIEV